MRVAMIAAAMTVALTIPGAAVAQSPAPGSSEKSGTTDTSTKNSSKTIKEPMQKAGTIGESSATSGKTDNTGKTGNTGK